MKNLKVSGIVFLLLMILMTGCSKETMDALKADLSNPKINSEINKSGLSKEQIDEAKNSIAMELYGISFDEMQKMALDSTLTTASLSTVSPAITIGYSAGNQKATNVLSIAMNNVNKTLLERINNTETQTKQSAGEPD